MTAKWKKLKNYMKYEKTTLKKNDRQENDDDFGARVIRKTNHINFFFLIRQRECKTIIT